MNLRVVSGLCAAFVLGVGVGQIRWRDSTEPMARASLPLLRAASKESIGECNCARLQQETIAEPPLTSDATDPAALFEAALAHPDSAGKVATLNRAFTRWLLAAPTQAMNSAGRIPIESREAIVTAALAKLAEQRPVETLNVLSGVTESFTPYASAVLPVIARTDPRKALDWATQSSDRDPGGEIMRAIIPAIAPANTDMAARAVTAMAERASASLIQQVAAEYAVHDPQQAYAWARNFEQTRSPAAMDEITNGISASLAAHSVDDAVAFLIESTDPRIRTSLIREIANRKSETDLREAWGWLSQYRTDAAYSENARNLLYRWAYLRPEEVANLLRNVTDVDMRASVARELSLQWQRRDSSAYQAWVAALPPGPLKAAMLPSVAATQD